MDRELSNAANASAARLVRVWDLPTRLFHWALVILIALQYATGQFGLLDMRWHFWFGYTTLALIVFRVIWGLIGSQTSRFTSFVRSPVAVWRYVRAGFSSTKTLQMPGHNALGGWSALLLIASVCVQIVTGLFASDAIDSDGPLAARVSSATVRQMTRLHDLNENVLLILIALHVVAVLLYLLIKHDNLILPMLTGRKSLNAESTPYFVSGWRAWIVLIACTAAVAAMIWWLGG